MKNYSYITLIIGVLTGCNCPNNSSKQKESEQRIKHFSLSKYNGDTLRYIEENFLKNKELYIGKDMHYFLDNLKMPIYKFTTNIGFPPNLVYSHISIKFNSDLTIENKIKKNPNIMVVSFDPALRPEIIEPIMKKAKGRWTEEAQQFFSKQKIKNIEIVDYGF